MRSLTIAFLGSVSAIAVSLAGCASEPDDDPNAKAAAEVGVDEATLLAALPGDYRPRDGGYPLLKLEADGTYVYDTGIRCIREPCPSGNAGLWHVEDGNNIVLEVTSHDTTPMPEEVEIVSNTPPVLSLEDANGVEYQLAQVDEEERAAAAQPAECAAVRCAAGTVCTVVDGAARCVR